MTTWQTRIVRQQTTTNRHTNVKLFGPLFWWSFLHIFLRNCWPHTYRPASHPNVASIRERILVQGIIEGDKSKATGAPISYHHLRRSHLEMKAKGVKTCCKPLVSCRHYLLLVGLPKDKPSQHHGPGSQYSQHRQPRSTMQQDVQYLAIWPKDLRHLFVVNTWRQTSNEILMLRHPVRKY